MCLVVSEEGEKCLVFLRSVSYCAWLCCVHLSVCLSPAYFMSRTNEWFLVNFNTGVLC
jgi:hypothetical protein